MLIPDGGGVFVLDSASGERRRATSEDWLHATRLVEALDDFGCYWNTVSGVFTHDPAGVVTYWSQIFRHFSKHVQEATASPQETRWMLEVLEVVFGSPEAVKRDRPVSFLLCPSSPLVMEQGFTDAYLETLGWGIPLAVMTMPLAGQSGPATVISNLVLANAETLAFLCLAQIAEPGTPFLYAPIPAVADPRTGRFGSGEVEHALFAAGVTEMAQRYDLPVQASAGGTDHHQPGIQAGYERALNFLLPVLASPDLLVGPGLLGGSMIFCPEQMMIDLEIIRRCRRLAQGIATESGKWLEVVTRRVGPGGNFMNQRSTRQAYHNGEIYISSMGCHMPFELWQETGEKDLLEEVRQQMRQVLAKAESVPLTDETERALVQIAARAKKIQENS